MPFNPTSLKRRHTAEQDEPSWHIEQPLLVEQSSERKCRRAAYYCNGKPPTADFRAPNVYLRLGSPKKWFGISASCLASKASVTDVIIVSGSELYPYCMGVYIKSDINPCPNNEGRAIFKFVGDGDKFLFYWGNMCKWIIGKDYQCDIGWLTSRKSTSYCPSEVSGWRQLQPISKEFDLFNTVQVCKVPAPPSPSAEKLPSNNRCFAKPTAKPPTPPTPPLEPSIVDPPAPCSISEDDPTDDSVGIPVPRTPYLGQPMQPTPKWHPRFSLAKRGSEKTAEEITAKRERLDKFPTAVATPPPSLRPSRGFWRERFLAPNELDLPMTRLCISVRCNGKPVVADNIQIKPADHDSDVEEGIATVDPYMSFEEDDKSMATADSFPSHGLVLAGKTIGKRVDELQRQPEQNASGGQVAKFAVSVSELEAKVKKKILDAETDDIVDDLFHLAKVAEEEGAIQTLGTELSRGSNTPEICDELASSSSTCSSTSSSSSSPFLRSKNMVLRSNKLQSRQASAVLLRHKHLQRRLKRCLLIHLQHQIGNLQVAHRVRSIEGDYHDPHTIRFCQDSISRLFQCGTPIADTIRQLRMGTCTVEDIPRISVFPWSGGLFTADNRRLWVFKQHGHHIPVRHITRAQVDSRKLTTQNNGSSTRLR